MASFQRPNRGVFGGELKEVVLPFSTLAANGSQPVWRPSSDVLIEAVRFGGNAGPTADATNLCLFAHPASVSTVPTSGLATPLRMITSGQTLTSGGRVSYKFSTDSPLVASVSGQNSGTGAPQYNVVLKGDEVCVGTGAALTGATQLFVVIRYREIDAARLALSNAAAYDAGV